MNGALISARTLEEEYQDEELNLQTVLVWSTDNDNMIIQINDTNLKDIKTSALIDSRAQGHFIDQSQVNKGKTRRLARPIIVRNVDGTKMLQEKSHMKQESNIKLE